MLVAKFVVDIMYFCKKKIKNKVEHSSNGSGNVSSDSSFYKMTRTYTDLLLTWISKKGIE